MKRLIPLFLAVLIFSGCALSTIKPYKKEAVVEKPVQKSVIERIIEPVKKAVPVVKEDLEGIK